MGLGDGDQMESESDTFFFRMINTLGIVIYSLCLHYSTTVGVRHF